MCVDLSAVFFFCFSTYESHEHIQVVQFSDISLNIWPKNGALCPFGWVPTITCVRKTRKQTVLHTGGILTRCELRPTGGAASSPEHLQTLAICSFSRGPPALRLGCRAQGSRKTLFWERQRDLIAEVMGGFGNSV